MEDEILETDVDEIAIKNWNERYGEDEPDVQVAPGIWQSKEDYEANMKFDEMRDNEL